MSKNFRNGRTKRFPFFGFVVLGITIIFTSGCHQLSMTKEKGIRLIEERKSEEAVKYYEKFVERYPEKALYYYNRGLARQIGEDFEKALEDYSKAIQLDEKYISAYLNRGLVRYKLGDLEGAIQDYGRVIELDPKNSKAYNMRGRIRIDLGYYEEAILDFTSALQINPDDLSVLSDRAFAYQCMENYESAIKNYDQLLQKDPGNARAYNNRGSAEMRNENIHGALSDFDKAIAVDPEYAMAFYNRAVAWMKLADYQKAILNFEKAVEIDGNLKSKVRGHLKICLKKIGSIQEPFKIFPQKKAARIPQLDHETSTVNIEVPVRVFKDGQFADNLVLEDFEVYEDGVLQKIEAVYLVEKTNIHRQELKKEKFEPAIASRHFVLFFEIVQYLPEIGEALDYFFASVLTPRDSLLVVTPARTYSLNAHAMERMPRQKILSQLKEKIRKDSWRGSREYRDLLDDYQELMHPFMMNLEDYRHKLLTDVTKDFKNIKRFDEAKAEAFAEYLKDKKGQKHVFLFYQKEMFPVHPFDIDVLLEIRSRTPLDTERITRIFADKSISCHFLYITKKATDDKGNPYYQRSDWYDMTPDTFQALMTLAEATGGLMESSYDGKDIFKKAFIAAENYYLLYYSPKNYQPDGNFRKINIKIKGGGFRILHRAGYFAD
ncbi:MAG: tetratricopeptide repeat protein [Candidatus Aminicenantes bacterium]|nr:tetratricopeptide repeat protein [Candidatus Aminicenantes bacterium]